MNNQNVRFTYLAFSSAVILMMCTLTACNHSTSTNDTNGMYSSNATSAQVNAT